MEKEPALKPGSVYPAPGEPHFDAEWTVWSARPVVPLEQLRSAAGRPRPLKLVLSFVVAIVLGALVALISIQIKETSGQLTNGVEVMPEQNQATAREEIPEQSLLENPNNSDLRASYSKAEVTRSSEGETVGNVAEKAKPLQLRIQKPLPESNLRQEEDVVKTVETRPRLLDQWEERRPRRVVGSQHR